MAAQSYPPSESGRWNVTLDRKVEAAGFVYRPAHLAILVDQATLEAMMASDAEAIAGVVAA